VEQQGWLEAADGARVALHRWGEATPGVPVLLWGHANGFAAGCYLPLLGALARDFDVWAWDARGQGCSELPPSGETGLEAIAGDAAMVLRAVAGRTGQVPHVASHSFSGVALLWAGLTLGLEWRSATFFEPPLCMPAQLADAGEGRRHLARVEGTLRRRALWPSPEAFAERLAATPGFALISPEALLLHARAVLRPEGEGFALRCAPETEAAIYRAMWDAAPFLALRPLGGRMRFVASDATPPAPASPARLPQPLAARACDAMFSELAGCSHLLALERPLECAALVRQTALGVA
jgi:pimeloyl-ACP methyl ester carboxylesterase